MAAQSEPIDKDVKREMQMASLQHDLSHASKLKDIVLYMLNAGFSSEWIAVRYGHMGATLERVAAFKAAIDGAKRAKEEREAARTGSGNES